MIRYKLVDQTYRSRTGKENETLWQVGIWQEAKGSGITLCTIDVIHTYETPLLAVLLNPIHADLKDPRLIEVECSETVANDGTIMGHKRACMVGELPLPFITLEQAVRFGILCALNVFQETWFVEWAQKWLSGENRSKEAAEAVRTLARETTEKTDAAEAAAQAASLASTARAWMSPSTESVEVANWMVEAASWVAADAVSRAAAWAVTIKKINLTALAEQAMKEER